MIAAGGADLNTYEWDRMNGGLVDRPSLEDELAAERDRPAEGKEIGRFAHAR